MTSSADVEREDVQFPAPSSLERRWPWLAVVVAAHLTVSLAIAFVMELQGDGIPVYLMLGFLFGQIALIAVWTAWAPAPFFTRLAVGLLATTFVALTFAALVLRSGPDGAVSAVVYGAIFFAQWLLMQIPLWLARLCWGQRIVLADEANAIAGGELQFGLAQLLTLTTLVAALFGLGRWFFSPQVIEELRGEWWVFVAIGGFLALFSTLAPLPAIWAALANRPAGWLILAALYLSLVTLAESFILTILPGGSTDWSIVAWINLALFAVTVATLLAFRACGFRLRR